MTDKLKKLTDYKVGSCCEVVDYVDDKNTEEDIMAVQKIREFGFVKGAKVTIQHIAPFGSDPIAAEVRGSLIALRRIDAERIYVKDCPQKT